MDLNEHYCLFCLNGIIPYSTSTQDGEGGDGGTTIKNATPNFNLVCSYLGVKVPIERQSDDKDEGVERESIFSATCDKFLCLGCYERMDNLRGLYKQLEEIRERIGSVTQVIKSVIVENSSFSTIITGGSLSQFDFDKVLRNHVRQVTTLSSIWRETIDIESVELEFKDDQVELLVTTEIPNEDRFGIWSSTFPGEETTTTTSVEEVACPSSSCSEEDSSNCPSHEEAIQTTSVAVNTIDSGGTISLRSIAELEIDGKKILQCPHCKKPYERIKSLRNHISRNHNTTTSSSSTSTSKVTSSFLTCHLCNLTPLTSSYRKTKYTNEESLKRHIFFRHTSGPKYKCDQCPKSYHSKQQLNNHINSEHKGLRHPCPECPKQFINQSHLKRHVKLSHTREGLYECALCSKTFALPWELRRHMIFHDDSATKDFICDSCGKKFLTRPQLTNHVYEVHQSEKSKRYQCAQCPARFRGRLQLEYHVRTHTGEKPFECPFCEKGFAQKSQVNQHVKVMHEQIPKKRGRKRKIRAEEEPEEVIMTSVVNIDNSSQDTDL